MKDIIVCVIYKARNLDELEELDIDVEDVIRDSLYNTITAETPQGDVDFELDTILVAKESATVVADGSYKIMKC